MSSELKLTNIKHPSSGSNNLVLASDGNVSITNTLSAGTIGGGVVFPTGIIETQNVIKYVHSNNGNYTNDGSTEKVSTRKNGDDAAVESVSVIAGHTYVYTYQFWLEAWRNGGSNTASRTAKVRLYDGDATKSQGDSSSFGTLIAYGIYGREMYGSAGSSQTSYAFVTISGVSYYSSDDTRYIYITTQPPHASHRNAVYMTSTFPMYLKIEKIKGNVLTTRSA